MDYEPVAAISVLSNTNKLMGKAMSGHNIATNRDEVNVRVGSFPFTTLCRKWHRDFVR